MIWGLCDVVSAAAFYADSDQRVYGLILLNPWVFTEQGSATVFIKVYYLKRLLSTDFWRKIVTVEIDYRDTVYSFFSNLKSTIGPRLDLTKLIQSVLARIKTRTEYARTFETNASTDHSAIEKNENNLPLPERMLLGLKRFKHPILFILSGNDLTADEFREVVNNSKEWRELLSQEHVTIQEVKEADHTFSTRKWRGQVASWTLDWVKR